MWRAAAIQRQFTIPIRTLAITGRMSITAIANPIRSGWTGLAATRIGELLMIAVTSRQISAEV